jgi:hypothetical protein
MSMHGIVVKDNKRGYMNKMNLMGPYLLSICYSILINNNPTKLKDGDPVSF